MQFQYKCPVCRANNSVSKENQTCRRCGSDFSLIYQIKKRILQKVLQMSRKHSREKR